MCRHARLCVRGRVLRAAAGWQAGRMSESTQARPAVTVRSKVSLAAL